MASTIRCAIDFSVSGPAACPMGDGSRPRWLQPPKGQPGCMGSEPGSFRAKPIINVEPLCMRTGTRCVVMQTSPWRATCPRPDQQQHPAGIFNRPRFIPAMQSHKSGRRAGASARAKHKTSKEGGLQRQSIKVPTHQGKANRIAAAQQHRDAKRRELLERKRKLSAPIVVAMLSLSSEWSQAHMLQAEKKCIPRCV